MKSVLLASAALGVTVVMTSAPGAPAYAATDNKDSEISALKAEIKRLAAKAEEDQRAANAEINRLAVKIDQLEAKQDEANARVEGLKAAQASPAEASSKAASLAGADSPGEPKALAASYSTIGVNPITVLSRNATVPAAVAAVRVLPVGRPALNGLTNGLKLGQDITVQLYGALAGSYSHDTSSPYGNEFPLPGFIGNVNGPNAFPETHIKAGNSIIGTNVRWANVLPNTTAFAVAEMDFNGNFAASSNSTIGSFEPRLRRAFGRLDYCADNCRSADATDFFVLVGQDWTPFASSTQPALMEQTLDGAGFGNIYARLPQVRLGVDRKLGGERGLHVGAEIAVVQSASGAGGGFSSAQGLQVQLAQGERLGADSDRPEFQARLVAQFQLDKAEGVPPAQFIISGMEGRQTAIISASAVPAAYQASFPSGAKTSAQRYGVTLEEQLPTRWLTISGKYYFGAGLRYYGGVEYFGWYNKTSGLINTATASSVDGSDTLVFGMLNGVPVLAPQRTPRAQGGFVQVGLPISRWFGASPQGWNAGWSGQLTFGVDGLNKYDVRHLGGGRQTSDLFSGGIRYQLNSYVTFGFDESVYVTNATALTATGLYPSFQGRPTHSWSDVRSEGGVIFAF